MASARQRDLAQLFEGAFPGVILGSGLSLRDAQVVDSFGEDPIDLSDPEANVLDDWRAIPLRELERNCIAHLDPEGFRYYLPTLAISVIENYEPSSMRVIGTFIALYPKQDDWSYCMHMYSLLDEKQKSCVAQFLQQLPELVTLEHEDVKICEKALQNYWSQYI